MQLASLGINGKYQTHLPDWKKIADPRNTQIQEIEKPIQKNLRLLCQ